MKYKRLILNIFLIILSCRTDEYSRKEKYRNSKIYRTALNAGNNFTQFCKEISKSYKEKKKIEMMKRKHNRKMNKKEKKSFLINFVKKFLRIDVLENQKKLEQEYYDNKEMYFKDPEKDTIKIKQNNDVKLKIFIMGAFPSKDKFGNIITKKSTITYSYHILGELTNNSEKPITIDDNLYIELKILFRETKGIGHIEYKREKYFIKDLYDFKNFGYQIKLPIQPNGGWRIFEFKIHEIPESEHRVNLMMQLRDNNKIWSRHFIPLFKPPPPPIREKFLDFLRKPNSTKWWYITLSLAIIAIIFSVIALMV